MYHITKIRRNFFICLYSLDLTYPKGHAKAGQPLDKVCIIGQSGTGKTTLLRFLQEMTTVKLHNRMIAPEYFGLTGTEKQRKYINSSITLYFERESIIYNFIINISHINFFKTQFFISPNNENEFEELSREFEKDFFWYFGEMIHNVFIPAELLHKHKELYEDVNPIDKFRIEEYDYEEDTKYKTRIVDLSDVHFGNFRKLLLEDEITKYQEKIINQRNHFAQVATNSTSSINEIIEEAKKLKKWEEEQINPLEKLDGDFLNKILNKINLKVKTDIDSVSDIGFIKLETLQGKLISGDIWSTGLKQILLTTLPLYSLKPENSIILFDEPERSLYPDIQTQIIDFYTSLGKDCQFFFATHSPIIASSFEPWEIVELKFNEEGNVYRELYFEGENHVDNYKFYPEYLRYDTILSKVFDLPNEANPKRRKILDEIAILEKQLKNGASQEEKKVLWEEYQSLQKKVSWEEDNEKY